jgi:hypothetical protein
MGKRQVEALVRISLASCAVVAFWTAAALPANAQYAVSAIKHPTQHSDLDVDDSRLQPGDVERVLPRGERLNAAAVSPIPTQPAWLAGSNAKLGPGTQSLSRSPTTVEARADAKAILVGNWTINIRPIRDEWDR